MAGLSEGESAAQPAHVSTHLPLVPMQQGRPVMTQSMWGWLVWFPALFLVQIWVRKKNKYVRISLHKHLLA